MVLILSWSYIKWRDISVEDISVVSVIVGDKIKRSRKLEGPYIARPLHFDVTVIHA